MQTHYLEYALGQGEEGAFLLSAIVKGVHSFIVYEEGVNAQRQSKIAIAPMLKANEPSHSPAGLRIFGDEKTLEKLLRYPVLLRYLSDLPAKIKQIPAPTEWVSWHRDHTRDRNTPSRLRRHEARGYKQPPPPEQKNQFFDIAIRSNNTGQQFARRIVRSPAAKLAEPVFNAYGLAIKGCGSVPEF